jgi:hypothetical protein
MIQNDSLKMISPHELAEKFEHEIKEAITKRFSVDGRYLSLLLQDEEGVYWSQEEAGTLCCLVVGEKDGHLYLVTAEMTEDRQGLGNFRSDMIS